VGTGNIVGVAIAITMGGPGAVFWMWIVALVGMATGFIEATLAQLYKVTHPDGTFRGGRAHAGGRGKGGGYRFVADKVMEIDRFNPQVAARLVQAFNICNKLEANRKAVMTKSRKTSSSTMGASKQA